jgi:hypothetical protein
MFSTHTSADVIALLFPPSRDDNLVSILEDIYPELRRYGIDILMMTNVCTYDEMVYPWNCIYADEPLFEDVLDKYDMYISTASSLIFIDKRGEVLDWNGKETILRLSTMYESAEMARSIANELYDGDGYDSDW